MYVDLAFLILSLSLTHCLLTNQNVYVALSFPYLAFKELYRFSLQF